jgi:hypothetical protein
MPGSDADRLSRAPLSLEGLSVSDAFGELFLGDRREAQRRVEERELGKSPWEYADDTEMALSIVKVLRAFGRPRKTPSRRPSPAA